MKMDEDRGELLDSERNFIVCCHPHGVFSFVGVCAAVATHTAPEGFGARLAELAPTAAASVVKRFPLLKDVLAVFGIIDADPKSKDPKVSKGAFWRSGGGMTHIRCG